MNLAFFQRPSNILTILITISFLVTYFVIPFSLLRFQRRPPLPALSIFGFLLFGDNLCHSAAQLTLSCVFISGVGNPWVI